MKALVTGGAGFIGSNIVKYLLKNNWEVRVIDNLSSGYACNLCNLEVEYIKGEIQNIELIEKACRGVNVVFHLAASVGRQKSLDKPILDSTTNLIGTVSLLEGMLKNNVPRIVYSSSASIFGELESTSIDEGHPQNPESPYGVSKLAAEKMILAYSNIYGIKAIILRYFNIYGVNQKYDFYGNVIPIFAKKMYSNEPITIYGDGNQTRDFLNVKDVARANLIAATTDIDNEIFNLGSGSSITINTLAEMMKSISRTHLELNYEPKRVADVIHCKANASKIKKKLGFEAEVNLSVGLEEYMDWFRMDYFKDK